MRSSPINGLSSYPASPILTAAGLRTKIKKWCMARVSGRHRLHAPFLTGSGALTRCVAQRSTYQSHGWRHVDSCPTVLLESFREREGDRRRRTLTADRLLISPTFAPSTLVVFMLPLHSGELAHDENSHTRSQRPHRLAPICLFHKYCCAPHPRGDATDFPSLWPRTTASVTPSVVARLPRACHTL